MYKIFLCLRYLRTRYIVLASIISVMLGVATMIVVNSVMSGFANEMQTRIHVRSPSKLKNVDDKPVAGLTERMVRAENGAKWPPA